MIDKLEIIPIKILSHKTMYDKWPPTRLTTVSQEDPGCGRSVILNYISCTTGQYSGSRLAWLLLHPFSFQKFSIDVIKKMIIIFSCDFNKQFINLSVLH